MSKKTKNRGGGEHGKMAATQREKAESLKGAKSKQPKGSAESGAKARYGKPQKNASVDLEF